MKLIGLSALLFSASTYGLQVYQSRGNRAKISEAIMHQADEAANSLTDSVGTALKAMAASFKVPAMVPESIADNMKDPAKSQCEGDGCQTGVLDLSPLFGYGCWCFFGNIDSALGRGPPLDSYDAICQKLALCYRCVIVDAAEDGADDCDPMTVSFNAGLTMSGSLGISNVTTSCQTENEANCSWRTCTCAMTMITGFFNLSFDSSNVFDDNLSHDNGFDYNLECPQQGRALDRQCCGFYPTRRTYDRGEARDCCHSRTIFNPLRHVCCDDGSHVGLGNQC